MSEGGKCYGKQKRKNRIRGIKSSDVDVGWKRQVAI